MKGAELTPPLLPGSLAGLDAWRVFADQLIERGDRLGPYLACELALGEAPSAEALTVFQKKALRICRVPRQFAATRMLGQVRSLTITRDSSKPVPLVSGDDLLTLRDLFWSPQVSQLERLVFAAGAHSIRRRWESAMRQIPASCRTFELHARSLNAEESSKWIDGVPAQVEVLRLVPQYESSPASFISDRFEWLDLRSVVLTPEVVRSLASGLRDTSRVKVRIGTVTRRSTLVELGDRFVVGTADDAALVEEGGHGAIALLERMSLEELQVRYGIVPAHAQLSRALVEAYRLGKNNRGFGDTSAWTGDAIVSRAEGRWWVRATGSLDSIPEFTLRDARLTHAPAPLDDGDRLLLNGRAWRFVSRCGVPWAE